jgi:hypothetical protein
MRPRANPGPHMFNAGVGWPLDRPAAPRRPYRRSARCSDPRCSPDPPRRVPALSFESPESPFPERYSGPLYWHGPLRRLPELPAGFPERPFSESCSGPSYLRGPGSHCRRFAPSQRRRSKQEWLPVRVSSVVSFLLLGWKKGATSTEALGSAAAHQRICPISDIC